MADETTITTGASPATTGGSSTPKTDASVTSGTASEALLKAASSVAEEPAVSLQPNAAPAAKVSGTPEPKVEEKALLEAGADTKVPPKVEDPAAKPAATADAPEPRIVAATRNARSQMATFIGTGLGLTDASGQPRPLMQEDIPDLKIGYTLLRDLRNNAEEFFLTLGGHLGFEFPAAKEETYDFPKASLKSEDGQEAYSAKDMLAFAEVLERKITNQLTGKIDPLLKGARASEESAAKEQVMRESRTLAGQVLTDMRARPHFKENEVAIAARLTAMDPRLKKSLGSVGALYQAYNDVLAEKVFPTIETDAEKRVREDNARKVAGSSIVHPAGGGGDAKPQTIRDGDVGALARRMEQMANAS